MSEPRLRVISREAAMAKGLTRYFTGEPCKYGHIAQKIVKNRYCAACTDILVRKWQAKNRERVNANARATWAKNGSAIKKKRKYNSTWRKQHAAERNAKNRASYAANPVRQLKHREKNRKYQAFGPQNPTGEKQWLRKNAAQLRAVRRFLRNPQRSLSQSEAFALGLTLPT